MNPLNKAIWFTGLSGSGKSTIGNQLCNDLNKLGYKAILLDGDELRSTISKDLGYSIDDREENVRRAAEITNLLLRQGMTVLVALISPTCRIRALAKSSIGEDNFVEIYINTPLEICESRDTKGLYAKARKNEIQNFTGIQDPYEIPLHPDIVIDTQLLSPEEASLTILQKII